MKMFSPGTQATPFFEFVREDQPNSSFKFLFYYISKGNCYTIHSWAIAGRDLRDILPGYVNMAASKPALRRCRSLIGVL
jgi:hypothetical protein